MWLEPTWCLLILLMAVLFAPHSNPGRFVSFTNFLGKTEAQGLQQPPEVIGEELGGAGLGLAL